VIFVDTGAFLARHLPNDQHRARAVAVWKELEASGERCLTSNFVLDETITLLARRTDYRFAAGIARRFYGSEVLEILRPRLEDELVAVELFEKFADQDVSFTDCTSFALMRAHRIQRAFAFDRHFRHAGFDLI
jgi:uncharacterized protein